MLLILKNAGIAVISMINIMMTQLNSTIQRLIITLSTMITKIHFQLLEQNLRAIVGIQQKIYYFILKEMIIKEIKIKTFNHIQFIIMIVVNYSSFLSCILY